MPFIPHTEDDIQAMLEQIGVNRVEQLFDEIPAELRGPPSSAIGKGLNEMAVSRLMRERARQDGQYLNFLGAGAYEHHIPSAVWQIATRGEFYSAYTPYQAEASQGTLQLLYEYQSMMCSLLGLDAANASLYDGATALAEAVLMAVRLHKHSRRVLLPRALHPTYRSVVRTIVTNQNIELVEAPFSGTDARTSSEAIARETEFAAMVVAQPNFFGVLEDVDRLTDLAAERQALVIACVNPTALALLKPPGRWGRSGADIAVGEGQPLGIPLSGGGPYFGFMGCKQTHVRQMPGRIVGRTVDLEGRPGFTLTLQAREQHIRRSRATSNICTNQGLAVTAATIYLSLMGPQGLREVALASHASTRALVERLVRVPGVSRRFESPVFHEQVIGLPAPVAPVLARLATRGILGGYDLSRDFPELGHALLVCATETRTRADLEQYAQALADSLRAVA